MQSETENSGETSAGRGNNPESTFSRKRTFRLSFKSRKVTPGGRKQQLQQQQQLQLVNEDEQRPLEDRKPAPATTSTATTSTNPEQRSISPVAREPVTHSDESTREKTCGKTCETPLENYQQREISSRKNCETNYQQPGEHPRLVSSTSSSSVKSYDREVNIKQWVEVEKKNQCEGPALYKSVVKEITIKTKETIRVDSCSSGQTNFQNYGRQTNNSQNYRDSGQTNKFQNYCDSGQTNNFQKYCELCHTGYENNSAGNIRVLTKFEKVLGERIVLHDNKTCCSKDKTCDIEDKKTHDKVGLENPGYNFVPDSSGAKKTEHVGDFEVPRVEEKPTSDYFEIREPYKGLENAGFVEYSTNPFLEPCGIVNEAVEEDNEEVVDEEVNDGQNKKCHIEKYPCGIENAAFEAVKSTNPFLPCYLPQEIQGPDSEICEYESGEDQEESYESYDGDICPELYGTDNLGFDNRCQIADSSAESLPSLLAVDDADLQRIRDGSPVEITPNVENNVKLPPSILVPRGCTQKRKRKSVHFSKTVNICDGETIRKKKMKKLTDLNGRIKNDIKKRRTIVGSGTENFGFCEHPPRASALPVVSLYSTPPRRHTKRQKSSNLENKDEILKNQKLQGAVGVPEAIKENFPVFPEIRPNRLSKIVKRLGPEVLTATATGTSTTDSVLAQVMKQQYQDNNADGVNTKRNGDKYSGNVGSTDDLTNCEQNRRHRKRKSPHDIFGIFSSFKLSSTPQ